jgi:hypothetical protein
MRRPVLVLLALGLLQMTADVFHLQALKGVAAATAASPAPKVFSSMRGLETFSSRFFVEWMGKDGEFHSVEIRPERAARMRGPYNRRNVYGAVLAYGPVFESDPSMRPMFEAVASYALCGEAPLLRELGVPATEMQSVPRIRLETRPGTPAENLTLEYEPLCK